MARHGNVSLNTSEHDTVVGGCRALFKVETQMIIVQPDSMYLAMVEYPKDLKGFASCISLILHIFFIGIVVFLESQDIVVVGHSEHDSAH